MTITAAADGSALGNPGPAGWAWYVDDEHWGAGGWPNGTNNQGELTAVIELLAATAHLDDELLIYCDSQYVINAVTKWMAGWKRKGWKKADGKPVLNREMLEALDRALVGRSYRFEWVKGHAGHDLNEAADSRARAAATAFQRRSAVDAGPGYSGAPVNAASVVAAKAGTTRAVVAAERTQPAEAADNALFDLEEDGGVEVTISFDEREYERLRQRAWEAGLSPAEFLRSLI